MQMGSMMQPFLQRSASELSQARSSMHMLVWMMPLLPSRAVTMAILDPLTLSIGLDTMGV